MFIIDRFVNAVGAAITEAGGRPNHFTGDGLIATFGLTCEPRQACRQAIEAVGLIGRNVAALNSVLLAEMTEPIKFGIGVHGSAAVVGEIGFAESQVFTTLGDAANVAARREGMCRDFSCEAVVSQTVFELSGYPTQTVAGREVVVRGREATLVVHTIDTAIQLLDVTVPVQQVPRRLRRMNAAT